MIFVLSPAKTLDLSPAPAALPKTRPELAGEVKKLIAVAKRLKAGDLRRLMDISETLAELNLARFKAFDPAGGPAELQAVLMFAGDVYRGLDARQLAIPELEWAQDRVRTLSGLYGVLRPLDVIQPYRLEMGSRVQTDRGSTLYDFWGDRLAKALNRAADGHPERSLINLASQEYFGAVDARALKLPVTACTFREERGGESRVISFFAKRARGLMARFAIVNRIENREGLKAFDLDGYRFSKSLSSERDWVFMRPQPEAVAEPSLPPPYEDIQA